jgi:hypothetical protein
LGLQKEHKRRKEEEKKKQEKTANHALVEARRAPGADRPACAASAMGRRVRIGSISARVCRSFR